VHDLSQQTGGGASSLSASHNLWNTKPSSSICIWPLFVSYLHLAIVCVLSAVSSLYSVPPQPPSIEAVPSDQDFVKALKALGLMSNDTSTEDESVRDGEMNGESHAVHKGTMYHLQLLLRTFAAVCRYQEQVKSPDLCYTG